MKKKETLIDPDADLIEQAAGGDEHAFEQLVKKYQSMVFSTVYRYIGNPDDVEDCAQEVFIKVWRNIRKFKKKSRLSTWIYRITANHCLTYRRKHKNPPVSLDALAEKGSTPPALTVEPDHVATQNIARIKQALQELPSRQRMALVLSQFEERSYKEIAEIMHISISSVESLIFRARTALKRKFNRSKQDRTQENGTHERQII
jgi:RNA polymerase sigma-70 factor (ECF subfamily)